MRCSAGQSSVTRLATNRTFAEPSIDRIYRHHIGFEGRQTVHSPRPGFGTETEYLDNWNGHRPHSKPYVGA